MVITLKPPAYLLTIDAQLRPGRLVKHKCVNRLTNISKGRRTLQSIEV